MLNIFNEILLTCANENGGNLTVITNLIIEIKNLRNVQMEGMR